MANDWRDCAAPSVSELELMARSAVAGLPVAFRRQAQSVALRVVDWPDDGMIRELGIENAYELTGLYEGVPLTEKSVLDQQIAPDAIWLFRRPILDEWAERGNIPIDRLVAHIVVHELAHHFGWSDLDIAVVDQWWQ